MDCTWVLSFINGLIVYSWSLIKSLIGSPTFIAAFLAPYFAIRTYLSQQRISRIQRIYYEESLLDLLKHLNNSIDITSFNMALFENGVNLILNDFKVGVVTIETINSLNQIAHQIKVIESYHSSKREILIILFKKYGYIIHQWLFKYDFDFSRFNLFIREIVSMLGTKLQVDLNTPESFIRAHAKEIKDNYELVMRHYTFLYILNHIISRVGFLNFKSQEALINGIAKDATINSFLIKFDKIFKIVFGYFKIDNNTFLSFLQDEHGDRFRLYIGEKIRIDKVAEPLPFEAKLVIIKNDLKLSGLTVSLNDKQCKYFELQIGIANMNALEEKPLFYNEVDSFVN